jgi:elongation factor 1 alpha-like protein
LKSLEKESESGKKEIINLVVIGHVDAGKSTIMGHLLHLIGVVDNKQMHKFKCTS